MIAKKERAKQYDHETSLGRPEGKEIGPRIGIKAMAKKTDAIPPNIELADSRAKSSACFSFLRHGESVDHRGSIGAFPGTPRSTLVMDRPVKTTRRGPREN